MLFYFEMSQFKRPGKRYHGKVKRKANSNEHRGKRRKNAKNKEYDSYYENFYWKQLNFETYWRVYDGIKASRLNLQKYDGYCRCKHRNPKKRCRSKCKHNNQYKNRG